MFPPRVTAEEEPDVASLPVETLSSLPLSLCVSLSSYLSFVLSLSRCNISENPSRLVFLLTVIFFFLFFPSPSSGGGSFKPAPRGAAASLRPAFSRQVTIDVNLNATPMIPSAYSHVYGGTRVTVVKS